MDVRAFIRAMVPGKLWLALAAAVVLAAGVATPLLASELRVWTVSATRVGGIAIVPGDDQVWIQTLGLSGLQKLDPVSNMLTTYTNASVTHSAKRPFADSAGDIWLIGTVPGIGTVQVISRFDTSSLVLTSWPSGIVAAFIAANGTAGDGWFAVNGSLNISKVEPGSNTVTSWTLPVTVRGIGGVDANNRAWFSYRNNVTGEWGLARLDPVANQLVTWPVTAGSDSVQRPFVDGSGNIWAALVRSGVEDSIIKLDPVSNMLTEWPCRPGCDLLIDVAVDSTGKVWFTEDLGSNPGISRIGRLDTAGPTFTEWEVSCANLGLSGSCVDSSVNLPRPRSIAVDSSGNAWISFDNLFNTSANRRIARLEP